MTEENMDKQEVLQNPDSELDTTPEEALEGDEPIEANEELTKAQELAKNQKIRAEKAEAELKKLKAQKPGVKEEPPTVSSSLPIADLRALKDVHDDDVEKIEKFAKSEGVSIAEAMKNEDLQAILKHRQELRKSAEATNTGGGKRGVSKLSPEQIVSSAHSGQEVDPAKLAEAELALRRKRAGLDN